MYEYRALILYFIFEEILHFKNEWKINTTQQQICWIQYFRYFLQINSRIFLEDGKNGTSYLVHLEDFITHPYVYDRDVDNCTVYFKRYTNLFCFPQLKDGIYVKQTPSNTHRVCDVLPLLEKAYTIRILWCTLYNVHV